MIDGLAPWPAIARWPGASAWSRASASACGGASGGGAGSASAGAAWAKSGISARSFAPSGPSPASSRASTAAAWRTTSLGRPARLTRADNVRVALASGSGDSGKLPLGEAYYDGFKADHCYDLYRDSNDGRDWSNTCYWSSGQSFVVTGDAGRRIG